MSGNRANYLRTLRRAAKHKNEPASPANLELGDRPTTLHVHRKSSPRVRNGAGSLRR